MKLEQAVGQINQLWPLVLRCVLVNEITSGRRYFWVCRLSTTSRGSQKRLSNVVECVQSATKDRSTLARLDLNFFGCVKNVPSTMFPHHSWFLTAFTVVLWLSEQKWKLLLSVFISSIRLNPIHLLDPWRKQDRSGWKWTKERRECVSLVYFWSDRPERILIPGVNQA